MGQIMPVNPAAAVRGPRHIVRRGKTPVLDPQEARQLIDAIDTTTVIGLRDRALIGLMVYSFARIGAAIGMNVEDVYSQNRGLWVRLHEKGGTQHAMPCHHNLEAYLHEYIDGAGLASEPKALLFQTYSRATGQLTGNPLPQANAYAMIQRRAKSGGITTRVGNHTFRATGVTAYLKNGGTLECAARMAKPCLDTHDATLRPPRRGSHARRGGADTRLSARGYARKRRMRRRTRLRAHEPERPPSLAPLKHLILASL
jgi:integrase